MNHSKAPDVPVLVIGAGPTGIGAAVRLHERGIDHLVIDAGTGPGGMAASRRDDQGFVWDLGGHVIHSHFPAFDRAIARSGAAMHRVERNGWVWMDGSDPASLVPAPVQAQLEELPRDLDPYAPAEHLADYYRNCFGSELYDRFFSGYNEKMWTVPLEEVDHTWTSLRSGGSGRNVPTLALARDTVRLHESFPYPVGGTGTLWEAILATQADPERFRFGHRVEHVDLEQRVAHLDDGTAIAYENLISTAPLPWLMAEAGAAPEAEPLRYSTEVAVGLGYRGDPPAALRDVTWMYSPDRDVPWFRGTVMSTYDPAAAGPGRWSMLLEVPHLPATEHHPERRLGADEAAEACLRSLETLGAPREDVLSVWTEEIPMAYPVPTLGRDEILRRADAMLRAHGVHSRGRFGGWRYESCNQDYSYVQGIQAVDAVLDGAEEDVLWEPERY